MTDGAAGLVVPDYEPSGAPPQSDHETAPQTTDGFVKPELRCALRGPPSE